jgi:hypothetical protein
VLAPDQLRERGFNVDAVAADLVERFRLQTLSLDEKLARIYDERSLEAMTQRMPPQQRRIFDAVLAEIAARDGDTSWLDHGKRERAQIIAKRLAGHREAHLEQQSLLKACRRFFKVHWPELRTKL